jgi:hypothetical protein
MRAIACVEWNLAAGIRAKPAKLQQVSHELAQTNPSIILFVAIPLRPFPS